MLLKITVELFISIIILQFPWQIWLIYLTPRILYFIYFQYPYLKKGYFRYFSKKSGTYYQIVLIGKDRSVKTTSYYGQRPKQLKWRSIFAENEVDLVVYNPGYAFAEMTIPHQLSLHAHTKEFFVGNHSPQLDFLLDWNLWHSKAELLWLGKEISDFLGLELQVIYPKPKMPPRNLETPKFQNISKFNFPVLLSDIYY